MTEHTQVWKELAAPFESDWVEKLPRNVKRGDEKKARCEDTPAGRTVSADGYFCGGWHARSIHLDYIGHAGVTMRLNDVVGPDGWTFEPFSTTESGGPAYTNQQFWGRLTILGHSHVDLAENFSNIQEAWGDCLRRCAMRFGVGTYLWSKSERAFSMKASTEEAQTPPPGEPEPAEHNKALLKRIEGLTSEQKRNLLETWNKAGLPGAKAVSPEQAAIANGWIDNLEQEAGKQAATERLGATEVPNGNEVKA